MLYGFGEDPHTGEPSSWGRTLYQCLYGEDQVKTVLRKRFLERVESVREDGFDLADEGVIDRVAASISFTAMRYAQLAKHHHFEPEQEWRFVLGSIDETEFYVGRAGLTPYVETDKLDIKRVWIGPSVLPDPESAERTVKQFLRRHNVTAEVGLWHSPYVER